MTACLMAAGALYAQGNGQAGITEATQMVTSYFDPGTKLVYAIGAVVGLVGSEMCIRDSRRLVVRGVHLPDSRRHHPALVLPLTLYIYNIGLWNMN